MSEPYLELTLTAYDNMIKAAGNRGGSVARVCHEQGVWSVEAEKAAPADVAEPDPLLGEPEVISEPEPEAPPVALTGPEVEPEETDD